MEAFADQLVQVSQGPPSVPVDQALDQIIGLLLSNGLSGVVILGLAFFSYRLSARLERLQDRMVELQVSTIKSIDDLSDRLKK
jgi:hypothetical protein